LGDVLRKLALLTSVCAVLLFARFASAQQADLMVGGSTLVSPFSPSDLATFHQPVEKGGTYVNISGDFFKFPHHLGLYAETSWRYHQADYPYNGETYRPIFTDVNLLFQSRLRKKMVLDAFAGFGVATTRFYLPYAPVCTIPVGGCTNYISSNHFMEDFGAGLRYYVWHRIPNVFVRPEGHYYHIQDNFQFHSDNVFRVGVSVGYTFGAKKPIPPKPAPAPAN
jgi:hypothetical protein